MSSVRVAGRYPQGRVRADVRRKQTTLGRQRSALWRLGDLSRQGIPSRSESILRVAEQRLVRSDRSSDPNDGGTTWEPVGNKFIYEGGPATHKWYDGTPHPWEFARVWHLEPSLTDPDTVYAGVEDAALFKSSDGGQIVAGAARPARSQDRSGLASWRRWPLPAHDRAGSQPTRTDVRRDLRRGRVPDRRRRRDVAADQSWPAIGRHPGSECRSRPLRASDRDASHRDRTCCSCRSTGT